MPWGQLLAIYREEAELAEAARAADPQACPNDGEPLRTGADGELFCVFDGWSPEA